MAAQPQKRLKVAGEDFQGPPNAAENGNGGRVSPPETISNVQSLSREEKNKLPTASVFRIEVVRNTYDYQRPWLASDQSAASGSGFAVRFKKNGQNHLGVITNAHVIQDWTVLRLIKLGSTKKYKAAAIPGGTAVDIDLALLSVEDPTFWNNVCPIELGTQLPELFTDVMVVGFPRGGRQICMTKGVVSRVTSMSFAIDHFPAPSQLTVQIDAAINPGNSGGPALGSVGDAGSYSNSGGGHIVCLGVATQKDASYNTDNIGYLVPSGTVHRFLKDIEEHGHFRGVPILGFQWTSLENFVLRKRHSLDPNTNDGVLITGIQTYTLGSTLDLLVGDVIMAIDGTPVSSLGDVTITRAGHAAPPVSDDDPTTGPRARAAAFGSTHQVKLDVLFSERRDGDKISVTVLRKKQEDEPEPAALDAPLTPGQVVLKRPSTRWRWEPEASFAQPLNNTLREVIVLRVHGSTSGGDNTLVNGIAMHTAAAAASVSATAHGARSLDAMVSPPTATAPRDVAAPNSSDNVVNSDNIVNGSSDNAASSNATVNSDATSHARTADASDSISVTLLNSSAGVRATSADGETASGTCVDLERFAQYNPHELSYDVLDEEKGSVHERVPARELLRWRPWHSQRFERHQKDVTLTIRALPVMQSVRQHQPGASLSYFMFGGLIFINQVWVPFKSQRSGRKKFPTITFQPRNQDSDQQVALAAICQHDCNFGYSHPRHGGLVHRVNGVHIKNLQMLKTLVDGVTEGFLEVVTEGGKITLDVKECRDAAQRLLTVCNVQAGFSSDLQ